MPKRDQKGIDRARQMRNWADKKSPTKETDDGLDRSTPETMASLCDEWLRWLEERNRTAGALKNRRQTLAEFFRWAQERDLVHPNKVTKPILESYQRYLWRRKTKQGKPLSVGTQKQRLTAIQSYFSWLCRQNYLEANPASDLELPKDTAQQLPKGFSADELRRIFAVPDVSDPLGVRDRAILETFYGSGARRAEITHLDLTDLDQTEGLLTLLGKGNKQRLVPVGAKALNWLTRYLDYARPKLEVQLNEPALFLTGYGERFTAGALGNLVKNTITAAEVTGAGSCHRFRHSCATDMLKGGADLRIIQQMLGHASASTTAIYTAVDVGLLKAVHAKTHPSGADSEA